MSALADVLDRLVNDSCFRDRLRTDPDLALADYPLSDADRVALSTPGPHWIELVARALRASEVPPGLSWDPADSAMPAGGGALEPSSPLPDARVLLRAVPAELTDGAPGWAVSLHPDGPEERAALADDLAVAVRISVADGTPDARAEVLGRAERVSAFDPLGPRWGHTDGPRVWGEAARALQAATEDRVQALARYIEVLAGRREAEAPQLAEPPARATGRDGTHITVVGLGITGVEQVTLEAEAAIRGANEVLYVEARPGVRSFLAARCPRVTPLFGDNYVSWAGRLAAYDLIAARVLDAALARGPVVLAVQGHPTVFSYVPVLLRDAAPALGLSVRVQPGISAEDNVLAYLAIDPADHGIQAFEATDLILRRRPVHTDVATLIWQVGNLETRLHTARSSRPERLHRFVGWLRRFFPEQHPVAAIHVPTLPGLPFEVEVLPLRELPTIAPRLHAGVSLYLPPVGRRPIADPVLARLVDDPAHLARLTQPTGDVTDV